MGGTKNPLVCIEATCLFGAIKMHVDKKLYGLFDNLFKDGRLKGHSFHEYLTTYLTKQYKLFVTTYIKLHQIDLQFILILLS